MTARSIGNQPLPQESSVDSTQQQGKWMTWAVSLYTGENSTCMWVASATLVVPIALFLFATLADCCSSCNVETSTRIRASTRLTLDEAQGLLTDTIKSLRKTPLSGESANPICEQFRLQYRSDAEACAAIVLHYNSTNSRYANQPMDQEQLNAWFEAYGLRPINAREEPLLARLFDLMIKIAGSDLNTHFMITSDSRANYDI